MNSGRRANVKILQEFITIIMGIGLANLLKEFIVSFKLNDGNYFLQIESGYSTLFVAVAFLLVRFYHGNMRAMEGLYVDDSDKKLRINQLIDSVIILAQGIIFSIVGLFFKNIVNLFWLVMAIFLIDIIWLLIYLLVIKIPDSDSIVHKWAAINGFSFLLLGACQFFYMTGNIKANVNSLLFGGIILSGSMIDYYLNRFFYFPSSDNNTGDSDEQ